MVQLHLAVILGVTSGGREFVNEEWRLPPIPLEAANGTAALLSLPPSAPVGTAPTQVFSAICRAANGLSTTGRTATAPQKGSRKGPA